MSMKILNLYAGIGGNRKLWGDSHEITAVEIDKDIAAEYIEDFPDDEMIVGDAHDYLLEHFQEFDFIWSSPPCPTHSRTNYFLKGRGVFRYPDMTLWQEIIFLKHFFQGKFCVENVISYYDPIIPPQIAGRHYIWTNFPVPDFALPKDTVGRMNSRPNQRGQQKANKIPLTERNAVNPHLGKHILDWAITPYHLNRQLFAPKTN